jgi:predicted RNA polymerase sigma factor
LERRAKAREDEAWEKVIKLYLIADEITRNPVSECNRDNTSIDSAWCIAGLKQVNGPATDCAQRPTWWAVLFGVRVALIAVLSAETAEQASACWNRILGCDL